MLSILYNLSYSERTDTPPAAKRKYYTTPSDNEQPVDRTIYHKCKGCDFKSADYNTLKQHYKDYHKLTAKELERKKLKKYKCIKCNLDFISQHDLDKHNCGNNAPQQKTTCWPCKNCGVRFLQENEHKKHQEICCNSNKKRKCSKCKDTYYEKGMLLCTKFFFL